MFIYALITGLVFGLLIGAFAMYKFQNMTSTKLFSAFKF